MILLIIAVVLGLAWISYLVYQTVKLTKQVPIDGQQFKFNREITVKLMIMIFVQGVFTIASSYGLVIMKEWSIKAYEHVLLILGSYLFGTGFALGLTSFLLRYYQISLIEEIRKRLRWLMLGGVVAFVLGIYALTTSIADYMQYPLASGIAFSGGLRFIRGSESVSGFKIAWYGILIITGTLIAYFVADHIVYKKYKSHGQLEVIAIIAFIFGIIGARLWYCLVLGLPGDKSYYFKNPVEILYIFEGGLAVQGGLILGSIAVIAYILLFRKSLNVRYIIDTCLPCIFIAQAVGRFGNFFNQEVYGGAVSQGVINIFPKIIANNMYINGSFRLPLFFIEACTNIIGFFVIRYAIARPLRKWLSLGDLAGCYFIWYGLTRIILEPLRDSEFEYNNSFVTAIIMMAGGVLLIVCFHLYDFWRKKKGLAPKTLETI